jgi:hypothetical protein
MRQGGGAGQERGHGVGDVAIEWARLGRSAWWSWDRRGWLGPGHPAKARRRRGLRVMNEWRNLCGLMHLVIPDRRARRLTMRSAA